jgi:hypothetical protein
MRTGPFWQPQLPALLTRLWRTQRVPARQQPNTKIRTDQRLRQFRLFIPIAYRITQVRPTNQILAKLTSAVYKYMARLVSCSRLLREKDVAWAHPKGWVFVRRRPNPHREWSNRGSHCLRTRWTVRSKVMGSAQRATSTNRLDEMQSDTTDRRDNLAKPKKADLRRDFAQRHDPAPEGTGPEKRAGEGGRTLDIHVGNVTLYH